LAGAARVGSGRVVLPGTLLGAWEWSDGGDLDCDGDTDQADLGLLLPHWGEGCP